MIRCFFLLPLEIFHLKGSDFFSLCRLQIQGENSFSRMKQCQIVNQLDQPIMTNGAWSTGRLNKCDWLAITADLLIFISSGILIYLQKNPQIVFTVRIILNFSNRRYFPGSKNPPYYHSPDVNHVS